MTRKPVEFESVGPIPGLSAIVLSGGRSRRMGADKATTMLGDVPLLQRCCRRASLVATPVVVVGARTQLIPGAESEFIIVRDNDEYPGPLVGFLNGLNWLSGNLGLSADTCVLLASCDMPFLNPDIISKMHRELLNQDQAIDAHVIEHRGFPQPFPAVFRLTVISAVSEAINEDDRSLQRLLRRLRVKTTSSEELRPLDPDLCCLLNINTSHDLEIARSIMSDQ